jgi:NADH-quinone oxidoreductase subunit L
MFSIKTLLILIPALPLAAAVLTAVLGPRVLRARSHIPVVTAVLLSFVGSLLLIFQVQQQIDRPAEQGREEQAKVFEEAVTLWRWAEVGKPSPATYHRPLDNTTENSRRIMEAKKAMQRLADGATGPHPYPLRAPTAGWSGEGTDFRIDITLRADPLTAAMLAIVTCVSSLVAIYSIGYMRGDPGLWRFFSYIGLFVFSMTMLVSASNFVVLFVFWELVGLCSYLLIGFWYERPAAAAAGKKAFLVTRIGDAGFLLGVFLIWVVYGSLNFHDTWGQGRLESIGVLGPVRLTMPGMLAGGWTATAICLLLLAGACGKSAQFPLYVWLPDAMEGPTPVSALIHAATMVTAGVYMVARCMPLFAQSPDAQYVVALVGAITALLGAIIAVTQTDLKRILAYSTISHLGYMFLALGTGTLLGAIAGMFHLLCHAFFKALLFLGAGSVMHAMGGVIDIRRLGGLRRVMPITHWTFLFGCLAIVGLWPFAGFFSKDAILLAVQQRSLHADVGNIYETLFATALLGILLIDFYMFRPYFLTFYGPEQIPSEAGGHAHESPGVMTVPLVILAFGSLTVGAYFEWTHGFTHFLSATPSLAYLGSPVGHTAALEAQHAHIALMSTVLTLVGIGLAAVIYLGSPNKAARLARLMDAFGLYGLSRGKFFVDPIYQVFVVWPLLGLAQLAAWFDQYVVDGLVDLVGRVPKLVGAALRPAENGLVQFYALATVIGLLVLIGALLM